MESPSSSDALRRARLVAFASGCCATYALAWRIGLPLTLGGLYPAKAALLFGVSLVVTAGIPNERHPFDRLGPANHITTFRAMLVALIAGFLGEPLSAGVANVAAIAALAFAVLDGVDGWLARATGMASDFGARFDMEVDALCILVLALLAWQFDKAGAWILLSGLYRYLFIAAGLLLEWLRAPLQPSFRRKTVCVLQVVGLILVMLPAITAPLSSLIAAGTLIALSASFSIDVIRLWQKRDRVLLSRRLVAQKRYDPFSV